MLLQGIHASAVNFLRPGLGVLVLGTGLDQLGGCCSSHDANREGGERVLLSLTLEVIDELLHDVSFL